MRGIEARRHDTCLWVQETQVELIHLMARLPDIRRASDAFPDALALLRRRYQSLLNGAVPLHQLVVRQTLSRAVEAYRTPSPAARAARQLQENGREMRPGQPIRLIYTRGAPGVHAWELPDRPSSAQVDTAEYRKLLLRAVGTVLEPFGFPAEELEPRLRGGGIQLQLGHETKNHLLNCRN
jgi:DNA polymerase I